MGAFTLFIINAARLSADRSDSSGEKEGKLKEGDIKVAPIEHYPT